MKRKALFCWLFQYLFWNWCDLYHEMSFNQFINELLMDPFRYLFGLLSFFISILLLAGIWRTIRLSLLKRKDQRLTWSWLFLLIILFGSVAYLSMTIATCLFLSAYIYDMIHIYEEKGTKIK
jgi:hypothetical protein